MSETPNDAMFVIMEGRGIADLFTTTTKGVTRAKALALAEAFKLRDTQAAAAMSEFQSLRADVARLAQECERLRGLLDEACMRGGEAARECYAATKGSRSWRLSVDRIAAIRWEACDDE